MPGGGPNGKSVFLSMSIYQGDFLISSGGGGGADAGPPLAGAACLGGAKERFEI